MAQIAQLLSERSEQSERTLNLVPVFVMESYLSQPFASLHYLTMNEDILHAVAVYADAAVLSKLCCVSQSVRRHAAWRLYRTVHIQSWSALEAFRRALWRDIRLAYLVVHFCEALPDGTVSRALKLRFDLLVIDLVHRMSNVETIALGSAQELEYNSPAVIDILSTRTGLRNVRLPGIEATQLRKLGALQPLHCISILDRRHTGIADWLLTQRLSLRYLRIDECSSMLASYLKRHPATIFPHIHTLIAPAGTLHITDAFASAFPALRVVAVSHPSVSRIDACWPELAHLEIYLHDAQFWYDRVLAENHGIRSLHLRFTGAPGIARLNMLRGWASPRVRALKLDWSSAHLGVHATLLRAYVGIFMLDIQLHTDVLAWMSSVLLLPVLPQLEVLTLRNARGVRDLPDDALDPLYARIPSLHFVRITVEHSSDRAVFARGRVIDWREACEIVADYLPHWRSSRAPWDDVTTL